MDTKTEVVEVKKKESEEVKTVLEKKEEAVNIKPTEKAVEEIPKKVDPIITNEQNKGPSSQYLEPVIQPETREGFFSILTWEHSPQKDFTIFKAKSEYGPDPWTSDRTYKESLFKWYLTWFKRLNVIITDVPDELDAQEKFTRTTKAKMGFNIFEYVESCEPDIAKTLRPLLRGLQNANLNKEKTLASVVAAGLPEEIDLQVYFANRVFQRYVLKPKDVYSYLMHLDNKWVQSEPLSEHYNPLYDVYWFRPLTDNHYLLMDVNTKYRIAIRAHFKNIVRDHINVKAEPLDAVFQRVLRVTNRSAVRASLADTLPQDILRVKADETIFDYFSTFVLSRWFSIVIPISIMTELKYHLICEFCVMPAIVKQCTLNRENEILMHNYLWYHFIRNLPYYVPRANFDFQQFIIEATTVDYLLMDMRRAGVFGTYTTLMEPPISAYFGSTAPEGRTNGTGWSGGGRAHNYREPNPDIRFHTAPWIHESAFGRIYVIILDHSCQYNSLIL